ncbi:C3H1-type domain-containing protein [Mycena venus]|uniref:C3H1-type domain-containing protein n=1 Tax=Mycena venus TaxID=2733690 RepID=A0A8H6XCT1_9AGAR|nr:C3H1-type domain-containing protein [Mycena venus]
MSTENDQLGRPLEGSSQHKSTASELRWRLYKTEGQIAALESQMAILRADRETVLGDLAAIVYPVLTLPNEITAEIFIQLWRAVALSTCRLWTHFSPFTRYMCSPSYDSDTCRHLVDLLMCWLPRAGGLNLHICIKLPTSPSPESDRTLRILGQYSSQLKTLDLASNGPISFPADIRGPFPYLTSIALLAHPSSFGPTTMPILLDAPRLREVRLDAIDLVDWRTSVPWIQLTSLDLLFHDVLECLEILTYTPNLEVLVFRTDEGPEDPIFSPPPSLPRLHTLNLGPDGSNDLLPHLTLPALDNLRLDSVTNESVEAVTALITRSGCSPTTLLVSFYNSEEAECMHDLILCVPSVRNIHMLCAGVTSAHFTGLFDSISKHSSILPALTSFTIDECCTEIPLRPLVQMLAARRSPMEGIAQLNSFKLLFHQEYYDVYAEVNMNAQNKDVGLALEQLCALRSQGLQLDIQSTIKWLSGNVTPKMIEEINAVDLS